MFNDLLCKTDGLSQVIEQLASAMIIHGIPDHIRSDNGPEFIAKELQSWLATVGVKTVYITPRGPPWDNGFCESFNRNFRDNLLDGEIFYSLQEVQVAVGEWVKHYNHERLHSPLGYRLPAPQVQTPKIIQTQPILLQCATKKRLSLVVDQDLRRFTTKVDYCNLTLHESEIIEDLHLAVNVCSIKEAVQ